MSKERIEQVVEMMKGSMNDLELVKNRIVFRVMNAKAYEKELQSLAHIPVMNLAIVFEVQFYKFDESILFVKITKELLDYWKVGLQQLWKIAYRNTYMKYPEMSASMEDLFRKMILSNVADPQEQEIMKALMNDRESSEEVELTILSNDEGTYGASCMMYEGALKECASRLQSDLLILPSSIHEVLLTKYDETSDVKCFSRMVSSINASEVAEEEQLSDTVYIYHWKQDLLEDTETGEKIRPGYAGIAELLEEMKQAS